MRRAQTAARAAACRRAAAGPTPAAVAGAVGRAAAVLLAVAAAVVPVPAVAQDVAVPVAKLKDSAASARYFVLAIGITHFDDDFWPTLKWSASDAKAVAAAVGKDTQQSVVAQVLVDAAADRKAVQAAMKRIREQAAPRDTVVVYVSSHGTLAERDDGELEKVVVLRDTRKDEALTTGLPHRELADWLERLPARRKLLVFATCHSGVGKSRLPERVERLLSSTKGTIAPLEEVSEGALILAAAAKGEAAREDDKVKGDIYTHYFLEALTTYDRNKDGVVTALEAHDYAKERTYAHTGGRQRPTADARLIGEADVPLRGARRRKGVPVLEAYDEELAGYQVKVDDGVKGRLPMAFPLAEDGHSTVTVYGKGSGRKLASYAVAADRGDTVTLDDVLAPPPYELALEGGQERWRDARFEQVAGDLTQTYAEAAFRYHWREWLAGAGLRVQRDGDGASERPGLSTKAAWQSRFLYGGYDWRLAPSWHLLGQLGVGRETMTLVFEDGGDESLAYAASATLLLPSLAAQRELGEGLSLSLRAGYARGTYDFGDLGTLRADRTQLGLALSLALGGVARRLP